ATMRSLLFTFAPELVAIAHDRLQCTKVGVAQSRGGSVAAWIDPCDANASTRCRAGWIPGYENIHVAVPRCNRPDELLADDEPARLLRACVRAVASSQDAGPNRGLRPSRPFPVRGVPTFLPTRTSTSQSRDATAPTSCSACALVTRRRSGGPLTAP